MTIAEADAQLFSPAEHGEEILITKPGNPVALAMQAKG